MAKERTQERATTPHLAAVTASRALPGWVAWYQLVVGVSIAGLWTVLLATGQVPEVEAGERGIWFHIGAEALTSLLLIIGGTLARKGRPAASQYSLIALGALLYTTVASAGYYADSSDWVVVGMFSSLALLTVAAAASSVRARGGRAHIGG
jgi:hypothetical protein